MKARSRWMDRSIPVVVVVSCLVLAGCGSKLAKDPVFQDQQKLVERLEEDGKVIARQVEEHGYNIASIQGEFDKLKANPRVADNQLKALETRILALEEALSESNRALSTLQAAISSQETTLEQLASEQTAGSGESARQQDASTTSRPPGAVEGRGFYHLVLEGETAEQIAARFNLTTQELLQANQIPEGRDLVAGQNIYVPARN